MAVLLCILSLNDDLIMLFGIASTFDGYVCVLFFETLKCTHLQIFTLKKTSQTYLQRGGICVDHWSTILHHKLDILDIELQLNI